MTDDLPPMITVMSCASTPTTHHTRTVDLNGSRWSFLNAFGDALVGVRIRGNADHATIWQVEETEPTRESPARRSVSLFPRASPLSSLERDDAVANLTEKLAFYLRAYPHVRVAFDGKRLDPSDIIVGEPIDLELDLPEEYAGEDPHPVVTPLCLRPCAAVAGTGAGFQSAVLRGFIPGWADCVLWWPSAGIGVGHGQNRRRPVLMVVGASRQTAACLVPSARFRDVWIGHRRL
ncbi:hypothetical protein [Streptomyces sp. NPDC006446]|uniref:hypothetical protein n=1 Tax=Streptomyces sp. NPDC006446 TaxID=3154301 RepID=UPI0033AF5C63